MSRRARSAIPEPTARTTRMAPPLADTSARLPDIISPETAKRLEQFVVLVQKWTQSINLISRGDRELLWSRHVLDSLRLLPLIPQDAARGLDLGSGAGFPGLVLALATGIPFDLVEADHRKAAFLIEAQRITGAPVQVHCTRIEQLSHPRVPLITARALAPLTRLLEYADRFLAPGGTCLFAKGAHADTEVTEAMQHWQMQVTRTSDPNYPGSAILAITDLARA